jgi:flagellar L-ring protein precursor FlgH
LKIKNSLPALLYACLLAAAGLVRAQSMVDPATFRGPAADSRAHRVGDLLTVLVLETTQARSKAATGADRKTDMSIKFDSPSYPYQSALDLSNKTRGEGETTRIGELRAHITVRVTEIEPNGQLRVSGSQGLVVNKEHQTIVLSGVVRQEDISAENTVWSSRIGEADLQLVGQGAVSEGTRRNIISRVFTWLGLL